MFRSGCHAASGHLFIAMHSHLSSCPHIIHYKDNDKEFRFMSCNNNDDIRTNRGCDNDDNRQNLDNRIRQAFREGYAAAYDDAFRAGFQDGFSAGSCGRRDDGNRRNGCGCGR
jgi:hypothetical protein